MSVDWTHKTHKHILARKVLACLVEDDEYKSKGQKHFTSGSRSHRTVKLDIPRSFLAPSKFKSLRNSIRLLKIPMGADFMEDNACRIAAITKTQGASKKSADHFSFLFGSFLFGGL